MLVPVFCMERILTSVLRIASVCNPKDVSLAIAAQIFVAAGVLILFVINLIFAMRLVRSTHPSLGWHPAFGIAFKVICVLIGLTLVAVITATAQSFYTLDANTRATDRAFQQYGSTFLAIIAILPLLMAMLTLLIPYSPLDRFGIGRLRTKVIVLLISTTLLSLGAWYRCGVAFQTPVPRSQPLSGYLGKAPFYIFNFLVEIQTVLMYAILRVDLRWHIPNGAKGPGSYSRQPTQQDVELQVSRPTSSDDSDETKSLSEDEEKELDIEKAVSIRAESLAPPPRSFAPSREQSPAGSRITSRVPSLVPTITIQGDNDGERSRRGSILSDRLSAFVTRSTTTLASFATAEQKQRWRASEESRIVRRLGGPWQQLQSPTESTFSFNRSVANSPTKSMFSQADLQDPAPVHSRSGSEAPSIPDIVNDGSWTPRIDWEFRSPKRFLSLKKRSMIGLLDKK
jgi:uncharacterized protein YceK